MVFRKCLLLSTSVMFTLYSRMTPFRCWLSGGCHERCSVVELSSDLETWRGGPDGAGKGSRIGEVITDLYSEVGGEIMSLIY